MRSRIFQLLILISLFALDNAQARTIFFVEESAWPPYTPDKVGAVQEGFAWEMISEVFSRLDMHVHLELVPQLRMLEYLKSGSKDGVTVISKNVERQKYLAYSDPIFEKTGRVYYAVRRSTPLTWNHFRDLAQFRIGVVKGHSYGDEFNKASERWGFRLDQANTVTQNFDKLLYDRVDVVLCNERTANLLLKNSKYEGLIIPTKKSYYQKSYHIAISKHSSALNLIGEINSVIRELRKEGYFKILFDKYEKGLLLE